MIVNVPHDPEVAQSTYNVNELRFLDDYEQPIALFSSMHECGEHNRLL